MTLPGAWAGSTVRRRCRFTRFNGGPETVTQRADRCWRALRALRDGLIDHLAGRVADAMAAPLPNREKYLRLDHRLAGRTVEAHLARPSGIEKKRSPRP